MAPRPTSPTSLLWAHQLSLEHARLLERIKIVEEHVNAVEAANEDLEERVKATEAENKALKQVVESCKYFPNRLQKVEEAQKEDCSQREKMKQFSEARMEEQDAKFRKLMEEQDARFRRLMEEQDAKLKKSTRKVAALEEKEKQNSADCTTLTKQAEAADTARREETKKRESLQHELEALRTENEDYRRETDDEIFRLRSVNSQDRATVAWMKGAVEELSRANHVTNILANDTERRLHILEKPTANEAGPAVQSNQGLKRSHPIEQVEIHQDPDVTPVSQASTLVEVQDKDEFIVQRPRKRAQPDFLIVKQVAATTQDVRQTRSLAHVKAQAQLTQQKRRPTSPSTALQPTNGNRGAVRDFNRPAKKRRQIVQETSDAELLEEIRIHDPTFRE